MIASLDDGLLLSTRVFTDGPPRGDVSLLLSYSCEVRIAFTVKAILWQNDIELKDNRKSVVEATLRKGFSISK